MADDAARIEQLETDLRQARAENDALRVRLDDRDRTLDEVLEQRNVQLQESNRHVAEALERQTATGEILNLIASSPTDVQPVLEAVAESAARLFDAWLVNVFRIEDGVLRIVAGRGPDAPRTRGVAVPFDPGHVTGRAILERRTIHIPDIRTLPEGEYPISRAQRPVRLAHHSHRAFPGQGGANRGHRPQPPGSPTLRRP